LSNRRIRT